MARKNKKISVDNVILYSIFSVNEKKEKCSFERLTKECFDFFPDIFSLGKYSWPDSRKIDRPIRFLRSKNLIKKDSGNEIILTLKGTKKAQEIGKSLRQEKLF